MFVFADLSNILGHSDFDIVYINILRFIFERLRTDFKYFKNIKTTHLTVLKIPIKNIYYYFYFLLLNVKPFDIFDGNITLFVYDNETTQSTTT